MMKSDMTEFMHSLFAENIVDWERNKNRSRFSKNVENKG